MHNPSLYALKPIWKRLQTDTVLNAYAHSSIFFICSSHAVFEILQAKGSNVFFITCIEDDNQQNDIQQIIQTFTNSIYANNNDKDQDSHVTIINLMGWLPDETTNRLYNRNQLENFIESNFLLFKSIIRLPYHIHYLFLTNPFNPISGIVEGMALSIIKENAKIKFSSLEISNHVANIHFDELVNQVHHMEPPIIAVQADQLYALQFEPIQNSGHGHTLLQKGKTYLITGCGKLAIQLATYLSATYEAQIILFGRRTLDKNEEAIWQHVGVSAYIKVDLGNLEALRCAWQYCTTQYGVIHGIFHLAGVLNDQLFLNKSLHDFTQTLYPKVHCTINLDLISAQNPLDFFICFSSITGITGHIGQSDYGAANGFLRSWSHYRTKLRENHQRSGPTFCIDWGLWQEGGMKMPLIPENLSPLNTDEAFHAMECVCAQNIVHAVIFKGNQDILAPFQGDKKNRHAHASLDVDTKESYTKDANEENLRAHVAAWVKKTVIQFTKLSDLTHGESIIARGTDSVAAINIMSSLEKELRNLNNKIRINKTILFDKSSIDELSQYLYNQFRTEVRQLFRDHITDRNVDHVLYSNPSHSAPTKPLDHFIKPSQYKNHYKSHDNAIAIIGFAGQFPDANSMEELWDNLIQKKNCIRLIPNDRWDWRRFYDPDWNAQGKSYGRHGGFIQSIQTFDPLFFNISPADAEKIDPQERLLLQNAYHAMQNSCYAPHALKETGVFISVMYGHYILYNDPHAIIHPSYASIANRISYFLNFQGPSLAIDTMCSGSLTALHLACQAIHNGDCLTAMVGGINLMPNPIKYRFLSQERFLSPTGKCHSFSAEADGYVPGEGAIVCILKKLTQAIEDQDQIYGTILGTAINSGGRAAHYTVPSASAQTNVIQKAIERAAIPMESISYIEAHGTGTSLGDPIEMQGLAAAYNLHTVNTCPIGTIKSNIGHLESAAGLAGIAKVLLQFKYQTIAPTIHCEVENPLFHLGNTPFYLAKQAIYWQPPHDYPRRAGVSAFGAGGSNAHVILEEAPHTAQEGIDLPIYLLPISGQTAHSLQTIIRKLASYLAMHKGISLYALCYSLACGRAHFRYRYAITFSTHAELLQKLKLATEFDDWESLKTRSQGLSEDFTTLQITDNANAYNQLFGQINTSYLTGYTIPWDRIYTKRLPIPLPVYPFEQRRCWSKEFAASIQNIFHPQASNATKQIDMGSNESKIALVEPCGDHHPCSMSYYFFPLWIEAPLSNNDLVDAGSAILCMGSFHNVPLYSYFPGKTVDHHAIDFERFDLVEAKIHALIANQLAPNPSLHMVMSLQDVEITTAHSFLKFFYQLLQLFIHKNIKAKLTMISQECDHIHYAYYLSLTGFLKSIALETPHIKIKFISLAACSTSEKLLAIASKENKCFNKKFEEVRYENDIRFLKAYRQQNTPQSQAPYDGKRLQHNGIYIISGGLGKLGQMISAFLLKKYHIQLILLGTSPLTDQKQRDLDMLQSTGRTVIYQQVDVTNIDQVANCIDTITQKMGTINGLIHAAGSINDRVFSTKKFDDFKKIIDIKIQGAIVLDHATKNQPLDFFIQFSSIASIYGSIGQADYAMGNAFLDAFANLRNQWVQSKKRAGKSLSINWPLWTEGGMQIAPEKIDFLFEQQGLLPITNGEGCEIFDHILRNLTQDNGSQIITLKGDITKIERFLQNAFEPIATFGPAIKDHSGLQANACNQLFNIQKYISERMADLLKIEATTIDLETTFGEYGFTSLALQSLSNYIKDDFGVAIPPSAFFTLNTPTQIIHYLQDKVSPLIDRPCTPLNIVDRSQPIPPPVSTAMENAMAARMLENAKEHYSIIGIDGIMPGAASMHLFWDNMQHKINPIQPILRWNNKYFGGIIPKMEYFDPLFFGLSARESMLMDPQHRLFLQIAYNTILDAGYHPNLLHKVGVFVGVQFNDYQILLQQWKQSRHPYAATGNAHAMLANRVSYLFNFTGPSQTIDTACSSALVALHRAMLALAHQECDYALVGAVSLLIDSTVSDAAKSMGILSPFHRCATFDASADGYVRGEGVGCILLKRQVDAEQDGDHSYGTIVSSAENHGGRAHSLTAPNPIAQKNLLLAAYKDIELAKQVSYIETHGTGTQLGDPIEVEALKMAWKEMGIWNHTPQIGLGALKSHIGHLEPAAGIAALLKVLLCLQHKMLPGNLHFHRINPYIDLKNSPFYTINDHQTWEGTSPKVAGISAFGFGGSNAHVVIMEPTKRKIAVVPQKPAYLICISAKNRWSLVQYIPQLRDYLAHIDTNDLIYHVANIAATLNQGRAHFAYRMAWIVHDLPDLKAKLEQYDPHETIPETPNRAIQYQPLPNWKDAPTQYLSHLQKWKEWYLQGYELDWNALHGKEPKMKISLPAYLFNTQPYWFEQAADSAMMKEIE